MFFRRIVTTPLKREVEQIKLKYPNHVLLTQVGGFYEVHHNVQEIAALLRIKVASINRATDGYTSFAGFPLHSLKEHLRLLLDEGKSVAVINQVKTKEADYITRKVARLFTPGTILDDLPDNNFLLSIAFDNRDSVSLSWIDVSTGEFYIQNSVPEMLPADISRIQPTEIIFSEKELQPILAEFKLPLTFRPSTLYTKRHAYDVHPEFGLFAQYSSAGLLLAYLAESFPESKPLVAFPQILNAQEIMKLDATTMATLEIVKTIAERKRKGSLFSLIDKTCTQGGKRMLLSRLKCPSICESTINQRLDLVQVFYSNPQLLHETTQILKEFKDLERNFQLLYIGAVTNYKDSIQNILDPISQALILAKLFARHNALTEHVCSIENSSEIAAKFGDLFGVDNEIGMTKRGWNRQLDDMRTQYKILQENKSNIELELSEKLGYLTTLNYDQKGGGPFGETSNISSKKALHDFLIRSRGLELVHLPAKQVTKKRFLYPVFQNLIQPWTDLHDELETLHAQIIALDAEIMRGVITNLEQYRDIIMSLAKTVSAIDVSSSLAKLALDNDYVRPTFNDEYCIIKLES
jgi:DNA mismatch repair protein MutS